MIFSASLMLAGCGSDEPKAAMETSSLMIRNVSSSDTITPSQILIEQFDKGCELSNFFGTSRLSSITSEDREGVVRSPSSDESKIIIDSLKQSDGSSETISEYVSFDFDPTQSFDLSRIPGSTEFTGRELINLVQALENIKAGWIDAIFKYDYRDQGEATQIINDVLINRSGSQATIRCESKTYLKEVKR